MNGLASSLRLHRRLDHFHIRSTLLAWDAGWASIQQIIDEQLYLSVERLKTHRIKRPVRQNRSLAVPR